MKNIFNKNFWLILLIIITLGFGITFWFVDKELADIFIGIFIGEVIGLIINEIRG